jgi:hypothetical protein
MYYIHTKTGAHPTTTKTDNKPTAHVEQNIDRTTDIAKSQATKASRAPPLDIQNATPLEERHSIT